MRWPGHLVLVAALALTGCLHHDPLNGRAPSEVLRQALRSRHLVVPVKGVAPHEIADTYTALRSGGRVHRAVDVMAPKGREVLSADDGVIAFVGTNALGGRYLVARDPTGTFLYYYAHLDHYARRMSVGKRVKRGQTIAYVGTTGNAQENAPHLHFQVTLDDAGTRWWNATPVNPAGLFADWKR